MKRKTWRLTAMCIITFLAHSTIHAADLAASATSNVTFSYRLIDLDLNDGITPWVNFLGNVPGNYNNSQFFIRSLHAHGTDDVTHEIAGTVFDSTTDNAVGGYGNLTASKAGNQISGTATATVDQLLDPRNVNAGTARYYGTARFFGDGGSQDIDWQLSPNTALIIEGTHAASVESHVAMLVGTAAADTVDAPGESLALSGNSEVTLSLWAYIDGKYNWSGYNKNVSSIGYLGGMQGKSREGAFTLNDSFQLRIDNSTKQALQGSLDQGVSTWVDMYNVAPPVPEASMVAMYAIGLPLLTVMALRRRRQGKCHRPGLPPGPSGSK